MQEILKKCIEGISLTQFEAEYVMNEIMEGKLSDSQIASIITILRFRGETVEELIGFTEAMKRHMKPIEGLEDVIDTCGTGGDGASTFNISTASAIVSSSLGVKVAKHGNRAVSSKSGSADVLEHLNIPIQSTPEEAVKAIKNSNMSFLFAPLYHSSMKHVARARKEIGFRTIFNVLGPLVNPARTKRQVIGVYSHHYAKKMAEALKASHSEHVLFVTGKDGLDEITITDETEVIELHNGVIKSYCISPEQFGLSRGKIEDIQVMNVKESAHLIEKVFRNQGNESARNIIALNAAAAFYVSGKVRSLYEGVDVTLQALKDGTVYKHFRALQTRKEEQYA